MSGYGTVHIQLFSSRASCERFLAAVALESHSGERAPCWFVMSCTPKGNRVISIDPEATVHEAIAKLVQNNIGSLPVVDHEGRLIGIFAERDVLRIIHNRGEGFGRLRISEVMTPNPVTCDILDDVNDVMGQMSERRIAKVPVVSEG